MERLPALPIILKEKQEFHLEPSALPMMNFE